MTVSRKRDELLDHEYDGIRELDNALPRWWLYGFYFTIAWSVVYIVNYHVLSTPVFGDASIVAEYEADVAAAAALAGPPATGGPMAGGDLAPRTDADALARGEEIFNSPTSACYACHRADLGGLIGPNLTDEYWIHGCSFAELVTNVTTGFPDRGMQPYGTGIRLTDDQIVDVVSFVVSRAGSNPPDPKSVDAERAVLCGESAPAEPDEE